MDLVSLMVQIPALLVPDCRTFDFLMSLSINFLNNMYLYEYNRVFSCTLSESKMYLVGSQKNMSVTMTKSSFVPQNS